MRRHSLVLLGCLLGCPADVVPGADEVGDSSDTDSDSSDGSETTASLDADMDGESSESESSDSESSESESSDSESSDSDDDPGDPIWYPPGDAPNCVVAPGDHSSLCLEGDPCPIVDDVVIDCEYDLDGRGLAIDDERVMTIAGSSVGGWLFTVQGGDAEMLALPNELVNAEMFMTGDQQASPHVLATTIWSGRQHFHLVPDGDGFLLEPIAAATPDDDYTRPYRIAVDSLDRPHVWVRQESGVHHGVRDDDWSIGPNGSTSFSEDAFGLDRLDQEVEVINLLTPPMVQLATRIAGVERPLGDPIEGEGLYGKLGQAIRPSVLDPGDLDYTIVYRPWLIHALWPVGESDWQEVAIAEAVPNTNPCPTHCPCMSECIDDVGGAARFELARTSGDELWLAWTRDYDNAFYLQSEWMIGNECLCMSEAWGDTPTSSFHLTRIDLSDGSYEHVIDLVLPHWVMALDIHAHDRRLGVRLYTRETIGNGQGRKLRVLGIDLDGF